MIRARFEQRFTAQRMAKDYLAAYNSRAIVLGVPVTAAELSYGAEATSPHQGTGAA